uniref:Putative G12-like protein n=1 Tax=Oryctes rhinoceros TaxID=72550 RepID=A0A5C0C9J8_ORYRH|nr:putative G12-like protein [Oryctes rhinoceros]
MKFLVVLVALLGASWAAPPTRSLQEDLQQIVAMIPIEEMREVARRYAAEDAEFQSVVAYLQGDEWRGVVDAVREREDWQRFTAYMLENGIDIAAIAEAIRDMIAGVELPSTKGQRSVRDFVDEVLALVDIEAIQELINELLATSPDFQEFHANVSSDEARQMVAEVRAIPEVQYMSQRLRELGIDVDRVLAFFQTLLGWE